MKRIVLVIAFSLGLLAGSWLTLPRSEVAAWHCRFPYTVQPGDTLSEIAARAGTSIWYLARLNGLWNVHYIYAGQVLCLPSPLAPTPSPPTPTPSPQPTPEGPTQTISSTYSSFDLVVEYTFYPTATYPPPEADDPEAPPDEPHPRRWTLGHDGMAGTRLPYSLASGDTIFTVPQPGDVHAGAVVSTTGSTPARPILWLARSNATTHTFTYTLVAIGDPAPILQLQLGYTRTITQILKNFPPIEVISRYLRLGVPITFTAAAKDALLDNNTSEVRLRAELIGVDGTFIPVSIAAIDYHVNITSAKRAYVLPGFALQTAPEAEAYQLWMALNDDTNTIGPPGYGWRRYCRSWRGGGWWSRWRRSWFGC